MDEHFADVPQPLDITSLGTAGHLIKQFHRRWFQARLGRIVRWKHDVHLNLNGILTAANPAFSFFAMCELHG